jgi:hypothetical protein
MVQIAQDKDKLAQPSMPKATALANKSAEQKKETPLESIERQMKEVTAQEQKLYSRFEATKAQLQKDGRQEVLEALKRHDALETAEASCDTISGTISSRKPLKDAEQDKRQLKGLVETLFSKTLDVARSAQTLNESVSSLSKEDHSAYMQLIDMKQKMNAATLYRLHLLSEKAEVDTEKAQTKPSK